MMFVSFNHVSYNEFALDNESLYCCNGVAILQRHLLLLQIRTCLIDVCLIVLFHSDLYHDTPWY